MKRCRDPSKGVFLSPARFGRAVFLAALWASPVARAEWSGAAGLTSDNIERGVSQSDRRPTFTASLAWRHATGMYASLGASGVSRAQYAGGDGYKLAPELGWSGAFGQADDWHAGTFLRGQYYPGAHGPWFGTLPTAVQNRAQQAKESNYGTAELGGSLGWRISTLSVTRSFTNYQGLSAAGTGPVGDQGIQSKGTVYVGLDLDWPVTDCLSLNVGAGHLNVPNFEDLGYSDWRAGVSVRGFGLRWGLQASGSNASGAKYRVRSRGAGGGSGAAEKALVASVAWIF